jgi:cytosine/adenosine deaminase-related metal-dependent hydrolase
MEHNRVGNPDIESEARMSIAQASQLVQSIAGPSFPGEYVKQRFGRAYDALVQHGFTWNRVRDLWHCDKRIALRPGEFELIARIAQELEIEEADERQRFAALAAESARLKANILRARQGLAPQGFPPSSRAPADESRQADHQSLRTARPETTRGPRR